MGEFIIKRVLLTIPTVLFISLISFMIIELPPGDFVDTYIAGLEGQGVSEHVIENLRARYGLDKHWVYRYGQWLFGFAQGNFGFSLAWNQPVRKLIETRMLLTILISSSSMIFAWAVAFPIGIYAAVRQYSIGDYIATTIGFLGLSIPNFLLALVLMVFSYSLFGTGVGGLFSPDYVDAVWSWGKLIDLLQHLWIPMVVVGTAGTAGLIRILRANLLDELGKAYVITARAKGVSEVKLLFKYPVRVAINPFISTIGWLLPQMISGAIITSVVLALPTAGPLFLQSLRQQDMYLAGSFVMLTAILTVIGTLVSDILLVVIDPRIRFK